MSKRNSRKSAVWLAVIGAAAAVGAAFLPWYDVPNGVTVGTRVLTGTPAGWQTRYGFIALIAAGGALFFALVAATGKARALCGVLVVMAAGVVIASGVLAYRQPRAGYIDWASKKTATVNAPAKNIRLSLESLFKVSKLHQKPGIGTYGGMGGGGLGALSGLVIVVGRRRREADGRVRSESGTIPAATKPETATDVVHERREPIEIQAGPLPEAVIATPVVKPKPRAKRATTASKPTVASRRKAATSTAPTEPAAK